MSQSAYITLVQGSAISTLTLDDLKERLLGYREQLARTGQQLDWSYAKAAFPYEIASKPGEEDRWFYLNGTDPLYRFIVFGIGSKQDGEHSASFVQVVLPEGSTHGDKAKATEFCKWLGRQFLAEVKLFNGRTMYYNPRK